MRILLFGGSFDPPHLGHLALLKAALARLKPDRIILLPAFRSPLKAPPRAEPEERLELLRLALSKGLSAARRRGLRIDDFELELGRKTFSYEAVRRARRAYPGAEIFFLVGSDSLSSFDRWRRPRELRESCRFVAGRRPGSAGAAGKLRPRIIWLRGRFPGINSTEIRVRLLCGAPVGGFLQPAVLDRIRKLGLYGTAVHRDLSRELKPARYRHSLAVARTAAALAGRHGLDKEKAAWAGLLHDCGRILSSKKMARLALRRRLIVPFLEEILRRRPGLLHSYVSGEVARRRFGVRDEKVLSAVRKHTLGDLRMSSLDRLLYAADACSADRRFPEAARIRRLAERSLDAGFREALRVKLFHILEDGAWMHPLGPALWNRTSEK